MIGTILFILAVAGFIYLVTRKSNSGGGSSGGSNPPIIKDPNTDNQEEIN